MWILAKKERCDEKFRICLAIIHDNLAVQIHTFKKQMYDWMVCQHESVLSVSIHKMVMKELGIKSDVKKGNI